MPTSESLSKSEDSDGGDGGHQENYGFYKHLNDHGRYLHCIKGIRKNLMGKWWYYT